MGIVAGIICNIALSFQEKKGWDDALGVWGVHGIGGFTGTILIGLLADKEINGVSASLQQLKIQVGGVIFVALYAFILTAIILKLLSHVMRIKPSDEQIQQGLDETLLNEQTYDLNP